MPKNNYLVIGFPKCGQVSADKYLRKRYPETPKRQELAWREDGLEKWENIIRGESFRIPNGKIRPFFITRDPIERIWSAYLYLGLPNITHFPTYLINRLYQPFGEGNPIMQSNFVKWIKPWEKFNPMTVDIRDLKENRNFPDENRTKDVKYKNDTVPEFPDHYRNLCEDLLELELKDKFWTGDHITGVPSMEAMEVLKPFNPGEIRRNIYRQSA